MGKTVAAVAGVVGAVAIAVAAPFLAPIALGALGIAATTTAVAIATAVISTVLGVAASLAFRAMGIGAVGAPTAKGAVGPPQVFRQSVTGSFIIYGKRRVGGLLVFFHSRQDSGGAHFRYFVIAVAGHRCKGAVSWMLNDEVVTVNSSTGLVTSGKYANNAWLWFMRGEAWEGAHGVFVSECGGKWTDAHRGHGVAKIFARFKLTDEVVEAGMPNITAIIEGRDEIRDPRDGLDKYTNNGALVFYDWMEMAREQGGFGAYADEMPDDAWISAQANVCDETVGGEPRYRIDGVIATGASPAEVRDAMIVNMAGTYAFVGGKHLMRPGYWVPSSATLSEDDLAGPIKVSPFFGNDVTATEVTGTYISPEANYQGAPFTTQQLSPAPADIRQLDLDLGFTTGKGQADRVASIMLKRAQHEKTVVWPMNIAGLKTRALDTVQLASDRYGLSNYAWQISAWGLSADFGVVANLREESPDIYTPPASVAPVTPPAPQVPGGPTRTVAEIQNILRVTYPKELTVDAIDAGSSATIRLYGPSGTSSAFLLDYPHLSADVPVDAQSITGRSYSTVYYPYIDVDPATLLPSSFGATTVYGNSLNSTTFPYRISLGRKITTPAAGGAATGGTGTGGGGYTGGGTGGGGAIP